jgi:hypothetical protein
VVDRPRVVEKDKVLDTVGGEELEPTLDLILVRRHVAAREVGTMKGA